MKGGVVADDITGANDIGSMFANGDYRVHVYTSLHVAAVADERPDVCIIDTNSRLDPPEEAYRKVFAATQYLQQLGYRRFFNKTCSVFRGNIGVEFDAMLDALGEEFAVVVLGFPKNGRLTLDGVHYVHGAQLADSPFRHDPFHPTTQSNLVDILQGQTKRKVALLDQTIVKAGPVTLQAHIQQMRPQCNYLLLDVPDQGALRTIAQAVDNVRVLCGSSALAEDLPAIWGPSDTPHREPLPPVAGKSVLLAAGSLTPQTKAQIDHLRTHGFPLVELDTRRIFQDEQRRTEIDQAVRALTACLRAGRHALVYAANQPSMVEQTQAVGAQHGLAPTAVARLVGETLAEVVAQTLERAEQGRLAVAGGETSAAICRRLGVGGMRIWQELQPGLPSCVSLTTPPLLLVLKSGSFGSPDFLQQACEHLQQ